MARMRRVTVTLVYDDGNGPETRNVEVPLHHCFSHAMRTLPYGARLLKRPCIVQEPAYARFVPDDQVVLARFMAGFNIVTGEVPANHPYAVDPRDPFGGDDQ